MKLDRLFAWIPIAILTVGLVVLAGCQPQQAPADDEAPPADETAEVAEAPPAPTPQAPASQPAPTPASKPAPAPAPAPEPSTVAVRLPAGTMMEVEFLDELSSGANLTGDTFRARVTSDVTQDGRVVIPAGSSVRGIVDHVESIRSKKVGGRAKMELSFDQVNVPTGDVGIAAYLSEQGKSETGKDAATIGGATVLGAIVGKQVDDSDKGKVLGAIVGAAAGTAIAAKTKGEEIVLPVGTLVTLELASPVDVEVQR